MEATSAWSILTGWGRAALPGFRGVDREVGSAWPADRGRQPPATSRPRRGGGTLIRMGRRITYVATFIPAALILALAVLWAAVRAPLAALVLAMGAGGWWLAHRFSPRSVGAGELAVWASVVVGAAISIAILLPDTRILCDCPQPRGVAVSCHCPVE